MRLKRRSLGLVLAAMLVLVSPDAFAAIATDERAALAAFLSESPQVAAARRVVEVARAEVVAAEVWANPSFDASREQIFSSGGPTEQNRVGLAVPVSIAGKRALRRAIAEAGVEAGEAEARMRIVELATEFRRIYARAYFEDRRTKALADSLGAYRRWEGVVKQRQKAGESAGYDVLRLQLQTAAIEARLAEARSEAGHERARLAAWLRRPLEGPLALAALAEVPDEAQLIEAALSGRSELARLRSARRQARLAVDLADRQAWPDPQLSLGVRQTNEPTVQGLGYAAGLNWPLPLFDRGQAARARAWAEADRLEAEAQALEARLRGEVAAGRQALVDRRAMLKRFETEVLPRLPQVLKVAELAYQEGEQGIVPLLDAHEAATQARLQHTELAAAAHTAQLDLETLLGSPLLESLGDLR